MTMENLHINHLAVLVSALANLALGALWYSPLMFYKAWLKETKLTEAELARSKPLLTYGLTFVLALIMSYSLAFYLGDDKTTALFEKRSLRYVLVNGGFITVYFTLIGFILGAWR